MFSFVLRYVVVAHTVPRTGAGEPASIVYVCHSQNRDATISYTWDFCSSTLLITIQVYARVILFQAEPGAWRSVVCSRFRLDGLAFAVSYVMIKFDVV